MNTKKNKMLTLIGGLVVLTLIVGVVVLLKHQQSGKKVSVVAIPDSIITVSGDKPEESLLLSLSEPDVTSATMKLSSIDQYVAPADPEVSLEDAHSLVITDNSGAQLYKTSFLSTPNVADNFNDSTNEVSANNIKTSQNYGIRVPRAPDGSVVTIKDKQGKEVLRFTVQNVKVHDNQADYKTITSEDLD